MIRAARANLSNRTRNLHKSNLRSPQPHLAKPAAKRAPSRAAKGKKPIGCKTQQKRARHAALTPTNAWHSARQACLRDRRDSRPRTRFRATQTSVADADARTASLQNAPPHPSTALRQRLSEAPRRVTGVRWFTVASMAFGAARRWRPGWPISTGRSRRGSTATARERKQKKHRRELHPADAVGVHRPRAARFPRPPCLHARLGPARCRCVDGVRCTGTPRGRSRGDAR